MSDDLLILGSTDVTLAVADAVLETGLRVGTIAHTGKGFSISYAPQGVKNVRAVDIAGWCAAHGADAIPFEGFKNLFVTLGERRFSACLVAGWHHMVPAWFRAPYGDKCVGYHASLLPVLRGGAPLNWAILSALETTGVSFFVLGDGIDDGPLYGQVRFDIAPDAYVSELVQASAEACAALTRQYLPGIVSGALRPTPQSGPPSYGLQRSPADGRIDWRQPAHAIARLVRAVSRPYPGALCVLDDKGVALHRAKSWARQSAVVGAPGQIVCIPECANPLVVCGEGVLEIEEALFDSGDDAISALRRASNKRFDP